MKQRVSWGFVALAIVAAVLISRSTSASVAGGVNPYSDYVGELRGADGRAQLRLTLTVERMMFRVTTVAGKYRIVRLRISNESIAPLAFSATDDRMDVIQEGAVVAQAVLNPLKADPPFWASLDQTLRDALVYPVKLNGSRQDAAPSPAAESAYLYLLLPADTVTSPPQAFRYTIASLGATIDLRVRQTAARA